MKVGRPRKYDTPQALERAVERYFASISYDEPVFMRGQAKTRWDDKQQADVPVLDAYGHKIYEDKPVLMPDGKQLVKTVWVGVPSMEAMYLYLGISAQTWANYEKKEEFVEATSRARGRIIAYLQERLDSGKGTNGAKFRLECMHGWRPKDETATGEGVQVIIDV